MRGIVHAEIHANPISVSGMELVLSQALATIMPPKPSGDGESGVGGVEGGLPKLLAIGSKGLHKCLYSTGGGLDGIETWASVRWDSLEEALRGIAGRRRRGPRLVACPRHIVNRQLYLRRFITTQPASGHSADVEN